MKYTSKELATMNKDRIQESYNIMRMVCNTIHFIGDDKTKQQIEQTWKNFEVITTQIILQNMKSL